MQLRITSLEDIAQAAQEFIKHMGTARVFAFYGTMGAGKTTFIKALCEQLGVRDVITSPTFAIVNEYETADVQQSPGASLTAHLSPSPIASGSPIYHFDFYRIKKLDEVYDMGYEDYFYSGHLCLIEWPELVEELLPDDAVRVSIEEAADGSGERVVAWQAES